MPILRSAFSFADELQKNADKGPGLKDKLRFWKGSKRGGKVQVQEVEDGVQVTEEISGIVDKGKDNKKSGKEKHNEEEIPEIVDKGKDNTKSEKEKHNEEEIQTLRSRVDELQTNAGGVSGVDGKTTADDLPPSSPPDEPQTKADEPETKADKERERKDSPEEEKESLMDKKRKLEQEKGELRAQIVSIEKEMKSLKELIKEVRKRKNSPEEEKESLMEKMRKLKQKKGSVEKEMKSLKKLMKNVGKGKKSDQEVEEGKDNKKSGKENEEDELQIEMGRLQKENNELQVELKWRRTHRYADDITLNPDTAHPNLSISKDKKKITHETQPKTVRPTTERFDSTVSVLGSEGFSDGKHYWEVDVRSSTDWDLGVARKSIERKGKLSLSPKEGFWALGWSGRDYWAKTDPWTRVMVQKKPKKIGIYLSYQERQVTFFNVTDMSVLFTFNNCSFSEEVYPFFKNSHKETSMKIGSIREDE
ncbi:E3 ubiquitin-protein ligase TRIM39-like [Chrysemys picta bellii]|uniref:E3 ubiquitin-protein ligase TRIM39-like n=1 Tax=Chrysemys picta bellii TaxID=8478 RepID=UPI0032B0FB83